MQNFLFELAQQEPECLSSAIITWHRYLTVYKVGYKRSQFITIFNNWLKTHKHIVHKAWDVNFIPQEDLKTFRSWRNSLDRHRWELPAVKIIGGRSLVQKGEIKTFPQIQKSKGFTICTATLELSSNQITHIFIPQKRIQ